MTEREGGYGGPKKFIPDPEKIIEAEYKIIDEEVNRSGSDVKLEQNSEITDSQNVILLPPAGTFTETYDGINGYTDEQGTENNTELKREISVEDIKKVLVDFNVLDTNNENREFYAGEITQKVLKRDNLEDGYNALQDKNKTEAQKEMISDGMTKLGRAVYEVMVENEEMRMAVVAGSLSTEKFLPKAWRKDTSTLEGGLGDVVVSNFTTNEELRALLDEIDERKDEYGIGQTDSKSSKSAFLKDLTEGTKRNDPYITRLMDIKVDAKDKQAKKMAKEYLEGMADNLEEEINNKRENDSNENITNLNKNMDGSEAKPVPEVEDVNEEKVDYRAVVENIQAGGKEHRSPYEVTPENFVDSLFNQINPRLYFTPPPEWVDVMTDKEQFLLMIQQELAVAAATKLALKDISADKARENDIINGFPIKKLKLIYNEMPGVKEAMEYFVQDLFEFYNEDGCKFLKIKEDKETIENKLGNFDDYKEKMFKRMALNRICGTKISDKDFEDLYNKQLIDFKEKNRNRMELFAQLKARGLSDAAAIKRGGWSEVEAEKQWLYQNAYEEKRAVATAWNFLFVGNIVESADIHRKLKPSQVNSDKIRTFMMPMEKFLQKLSLRKDKKREDGTVEEEGAGYNDGTEELFGGSIALWAKEKLTYEDSMDFANKLRRAADGDRTKMSAEEAMWRVMPKRQFCSFVDMHVVDAFHEESGETKLIKETFAEALMNGDKIDFSKKGNEDLDIFNNMRDIWDELLTVNPSLIGKGSEYGKDPSKYYGGVIKEVGLVTGINLIRKQDGTFGHLPFVDFPEYYAWLIANTAGIETMLDIPILDRRALKIKDNSYDIVVDSFIRGFKLSSDKAREIRRILNGEGMLSAKKAIFLAERRATVREDRKRVAEKRK